MHTLCNYLLLPLLLPCSVSPSPFHFPSHLPSCFPPPSQHPEGLVYAEVNVKPKSSAKPRVPKPDKTDDMVEYAAIAYQPKDAAEKSPPVVEPASRRMALPDNPGTCVKCECRNSIIDHYMQATEGGWTGLETRSVQFWGHWQSLQQTSSGDARSFNNLNFTSYLRVKYDPLIGWNLEQGQARCDVWQYAMKEWL